MSPNLMWATMLMIAAIALAINAFTLLMRPKSFMDNPLAPYRLVFGIVLPIVVILIGSANAAG